MQIIRTKTNKYPKHSLLQSGAVLIHFKGLKVCGMAPKNVGGQERGLNQNRGLYWLTLLKLREAGVEREINR